MYVLTLSGPAELRHAVPGLLDFVASAEVLPLERAVRRHRRVIVFGLVTVVLGAGGYRVVAPRRLLRVDGSLRRRRCRRGGGGRSRWRAGCRRARARRRGPRRALVFVRLVVRVILRIQSRLLVKRRGMRITSFFK